MVVRNNRLPQFVILIRLEGNDGKGMPEPKTNKVGKISGQTFLTKYGGTAVFYGRPLRFYKRWDGFFVAYEKSCTQTDQTNK
ncbi:MAG: hypothetical protein M1366_03665 [Patescibacteria group bacterium]|nr:hypothetical protein [Patescibacteria group bacterium]